MTGRQVVGTRKKIFLESQQNEKRVVQCLEATIFFLCISFKFIYLWERGKGSSGAQGRKELMTPFWYLLFGLKWDGGGL
jgi:hypothetical protein